MSKKPLKLKQIVFITSRSFPSFGGGQDPILGNPLSRALKDNPPVFAAGVDIESVCSFVIKLYKMRRHKRENPKANQ